MTTSGQNCSSGQLRGWSFRSRHTCPLPRSNQWQYTRSNPDDNNNKKNCSFSSNYEHTHHPSSGPLKRQGKELDRRLPLGCCNNCEQQHLQGDHAHLLHPSIFVFHNVRIPYFCDELHLQRAFSKAVNLSHVLWKFIYYTCIWRAQFLSVLQKL